MKAKGALGFMMLGLCSLPASSQELPVELKGCLVSETTIIDRAGDTVIGMNVSRGVTDRIGPGSFPEKTTRDCRIVFNTWPGGFEFSNRCNFLDAQGDRIISVANGTRDSGSTATIRERVLPSPAPA